MPILIDIAQQQLFLTDLHNQIIAQYPISSAKKGLGEQKGSEQTPRGLHYIHEKIGVDCPIFTVFKGRKPTGEIWDAELSAQFPERDWILSRIMWLVGEQTPLDRYIYIHGTADEGQIGVPLSHGCIRMRNHDVIALFEQVGVGEVVEILVGVGVCV